MKKTIIVRIISCVLFCIILLSLVAWLNGILISKVDNRYYMLNDFIDQADSAYDVHIYGSCHAYQSFNPAKLEQLTGLSSYVFANPGEIIPTTYLRMLERFKNDDVPAVVYIDIWGLNAYETYIPQSKIFDTYMPVNIETIPYSTEKKEVINDFQSLDLLADNFAIAKYKDRIINNELIEVDFNYSFEKSANLSLDFVNRDMKTRRDNRGFLASSTTNELDDYNEKQAKVSADDKLPYEDIMVKYTDKIIDLCKKYNVELVFYRAPYISSENELRKLNWFKDYCLEKGIMYWDLEEEIEFDTNHDFDDYEHLNILGANKATEFLAQKSTVINANTAS